LSHMRKSTRLKRSENILGEPRKNRSNTKSARWKRPRTESTTTISRDVSGIPVPRCTQIACGPGLTVFHGSLNQSSRIQQIRFGESRTDQLQTGERNGLVGDRNWNGQCGNTPEIHGLRILQSQRSRLKRNGATKERNMGRQIFQRRQRNEIHMFEGTAQ